MKSSRPFPAKNLDVVVVGGANWDYLIKADSLPRPGETVQGHSFFEWAGGKGANQAVAASRLGAKVAFIAKVGSDIHGNTILDILKNAGVDTSHVISNSNSLTGVALISVSKKGEKQITVAPGANSDLTADEIRNKRKVIERAKVLLVQLEVPLQAVEAAIEIAHNSKTQIIFDPAPAPAKPLSRSLLRMIDIIKPNSTEAEALTKIHVTDRKSAKKAAMNLISKGVNAAVVQAADKGNLLVTNNDEELWMPRVPVHGVDATGAGDAFLGALATFTAEGKSLIVASQNAHLAAALKTKSIGAQAGLPKRAELEKFLYQKKRSFNELRL